MIEPQQTTWKGVSLALLLLTVLSLLVVAPLANLIGAALPAGDAELDALRGLLLDPPLQQALVRTVAVALLACAIASAIAIPAAFIAVRSGPMTRTLVQVFGFLPLTMPPFIAAGMLENFATVFNETGLTTRMGELHVQGSSVALSVVFAVHFLPLILFSLMAGLTRIDRAYADSARTLGANRLVVWRRITLPLATPAYAAGVSIMLLKILEDIGAPLMLGVEQMLAPQILLRLGSAGLSDPLLNLSALLLFGISLMTAALAWTALLPPLVAPGVTPCYPAHWRARAVGRLVATPLLIGLGTLALAPHLWLVLVSLGNAWSGGLLPEGYDIAHYRQLSSATLPHLGVTLAYAAGAGILTLLIGGAFGSLTARPGAIAHVIRFTATAMFAVPGVVLALAYARTQDLIGFGPAGWPGFGWLALTLVVMLKQLPFAQRLIAHALRTLHPAELESARSLGASRVSTRLRIGLPALAGVIVAVFLLGFIAATMELSAVLLLIEDPQVPLAQSIYQALRSPTHTGLGAAQAIGLVCLVAGGMLLARTLSGGTCAQRSPDARRHNHDAREDL